MRFWIEKGPLAYPVEEVTVAGNLKEMLLGIEMVGNNLTLRNSVVAPTLKVHRMTVAGPLAKPFWPTGLSCPT